MQKFGGGGAGRRAGPTIVLKTARSAGNMRGFMRAAIQPAGPAGKNPPAGRSSPERLLFIDGLRGVAALAVLFYHFYYNSPYLETFDAILPRWLCWLFGKGWMGVEIFFVISGFVIAHSLGKDRITPKYAAGFILRRSIRLDPPYWVGIVTWIGLTALSNVLVPSRALPYPSWPQLASHLFYLQNVLGYGDIVPVAWSLCLELQFYTLYILCLLLFLSRRFRTLRWAGVALFAATTALSWISVTTRCFPNGVQKHWFVGTWYLFAMGVFAAWVWERPRLFKPLAALCGLLAAGLALRWHDSIGAGFATLLAILAAIRLGKLGTWLGGDLIQYFGRRSYSIYLAHFVVGLRVINLGYRLLGDSPAAAFAATLGGVAATLLFSEATYRWVERPSLRWAKKVKPYFDPRPAPAPLGG